MTKKSAAASPVPHPWSSDALLLKAQRYAERMLGHAKDDWQFALWSSFALELLLRAALAKVSPILLADNKSDWNHIYFALGHTPTAAKYSPRSIGIAEVAKRLEAVLTAFTPEMSTFCIRHMTTRNEELHTGLASFDDLGAAGWQGQYYAACETLLQTLDKDLAYLFGAAEAEVARAMIKAANDKSAKAIVKTIAIHRKTWTARSKSEKSTLKRQALVWATRHYGHRVTCPSCNCTAIVTGSAAGTPIQAMKDGLVTEKQHMLPAHLECVACGLKIAGLSHLTAAGLGDGFTSTTTFDPAELYAQEPDYEPDFNEM